MSSLYVQCLKSRVEKAWREEMAQNHSKRVCPTGERAVPERVMASYDQPHPQYCQAPQYPDTGHLQVNLLPLPGDQKLSPV